jgi:molecular chaperone DnaK (HSP70)
LYSEVLRRNQIKDDGEEVKEISRLLLRECERLKESLSFHEKGELVVLNPLSGATISAEFTRGQLEDLLDAHDAFAQIEKTIRRALSAAEKRGFSEDNIQSVLMVGGSSQIPAVQKCLRRFFGNDRVKIDRPLDTVARGASAFVAGLAFDDYIQHDYAIRYVNPKTGGYEYRTLVRRGTRYPSVDQIAVLTIKSSYDGQDALGIPIFEIGGSAAVSGEERREMYFDEQGLPRIRAITNQEISRRNFFWINENNPTFLKAEPPGQKGDPRFKLEFAIDENRRLLITAYDIKNSSLVFRQYPVVKLV